MAGFEWLRFGKFLNFGPMGPNAESAPNNLIEQSRSGNDPVGRSNQVGMTIKTGPELQALRKQAADRFMAIAMQYVPEGWTVEYHKPLSGYCFLAERKSRRRAR
jgi:hypothetical protein